MTPVDWRPALATLRPELAVLFTSWLPRLAGLVGPGDVRPLPDVRGEPDGFRGLTRRGGWEHLLASQWALADAVPTEFLRRATEGELLFRDPARIRPIETPHTTVFFDDGPTQLGLPRLVHLALWWVFERRAQDAGGTVGYVARSRPGQTLHDPLDLLSLRATALPALPPSDGTERFVVGEDVEGERVVVVAEGPEGRNVTVRFGERRLVLEAPPLDRVARYLSRPRPSTARPPRRPKTEGITAVELHAGRIHVRFGPILSMWPMPTRRRKRTRSLHHSGGRRRRDRTTVAVGSFAQQLLLVEVEDDDLVLTGVFGTHRLPRPDELIVPDADRILPAVGLPRVHVPSAGADQAGVLFRDGADVLWSARAHPPTVRPIGRAVLGPWMAADLFTWIAPDGQRRSCEYQRSGELMDLGAELLHVRRLVDAPVERALAAPPHGAALITGEWVWVGPCRGRGRFGESYGTWFRNVDTTTLQGASLGRRPTLIHVVDGQVELQDDDDGRTVVPIDDDPMIRFARGNDEVLVVADLGDRVHVVTRAGQRLVVFSARDIR